ncbi:MAG TPA: 50S ribosomal protein L32 [Chloroflexi bacterium]|nr:50S ribosomal protein L32 [Chloroflexota bacterium]
MGAVPKRRISQSKRRHRRAQTFKSPRLIQLVPCPECGEPVLPYHVCIKCGTYRRQQIIAGTEE